MINVIGYYDIEELYHSTDTIILRGKRQKNNESIILKILNKHFPSPIEIARFRHEYDILQNLQIRGVINVIAFEFHNNMPVLVLKDIEGSQYLKQILSECPSQIQTFLKISIQICEIIAQIHQRHIVHKDIKPNNFVFSQKLEQVFLIDFGISTRLTNEAQEMKSANALQGTLAYISPEQTGRVNRSLDYRTDLYSLGVTFYELLSGQLPYEEIDPMGWVYAHIAKKTIPLYQRNPKIPKIISDIVMKLMSKNAEDRYQSAYALKLDLELCLSQLNKNGKIDYFPIARRDIPYQLCIPQKLYGREKEIETLTQLFNEVSLGKSEMVLVSGYSGIGKSMLVNEIRKSMTQRRGYFIAGKYDQLQRNIPYSAIILAFQSLVRYLLTETKEEIQQLKERLLKALGPNGQVLIDVIPDMELIIGKQPPVIQLGPTESQNRFNMVFQDMIGVLTQKENPVTIFLDDLQWVDSASLNLIERFITNPDSRYFLLIGAYRDNEIHKAHPLIITISTIQKSKTIQNINLKPLTLNNLNQLIFETLQQPYDTCLPLTQLIYNKTQGNPFFFNEFLKTLYQRNLLRINHIEGIWEWDLQHINEQGITDNVVELMISRIHELPIETQDVLKLAACIGNKFELNILCLIFEKSLSETIKMLWKAVEEELVIATSEFDYLYNLACQDKTYHEVLEKMVEGTERFLHDRVQQAAYSLIPDKDKKHFHLKIGWLLLNNINNEKLDESIFTIVGHLNNGWELIDNHDQKLRLARLNLQAGKKAKNATAYSAGIDYLTIAMNLLPEHTWENQYNLTFEIKINLAECSYLSGDFINTEKLFVELLKQARSIKDQVNVYLIQMHQFHLQSRLKEAFQLQLSALSLLGITITNSEEDMQMLLQKELQTLPQLLGDRQISDLLNASEMNDDTIMSIMTILGRIWITVYILGNKTFLEWVCVKMTNLSLKYGNSHLSPFAYVNYGFFASFVLDEYNTGYQFGKLSIELCEHFHHSAIASPVYCIYGCTVHHWTQSLDSSIPYYWKGYEFGMAGGDFPWASYNLLFVQWHLLITGKNLQTCYNEAIKIEQIVKKINPKELLSFQAMTQYNCNLCGLSYNNVILSILDIDKNKDLEHPMILTWMYTPELQTCFYFEDYDHALKLIEQADEMAIARPGQTLRPETYFYTCLIYTQCYTNVNAEKQSIFLDTINTYQKCMKTWADSCNTNYYHKYLLVEAERFAILGQDKEAIRLYDDAIKSARDNEYIHHAALGNELFAKFYLKKQMHDMAIQFLNESIYLYQLWGATAKVKQLEKKYDHILKRSSFNSFSDKTFDKTIYPDESIETISNIESFLDLNTIMKSSQSISKEIRLEKLLEQLMNNVIENAGAQKGLLILEKNGLFVIEAEKEVFRTYVNVLQSKPIEQSKNLSRAIVSYVERTRDNIVLNDAVNEGPFINDQYIIKNQPKSILCSPIINQGKLIGMIYLENNLITGAFTPARLQVLTILSSQAAISLENSYLYESLEQKVAERTRELKAAKDALWAEIQLAKKIQNMLLPKTPEIKGYEISYAMIPFTDVGGDYYDIINGPDNDWVIIGDVSGHGLSSGLVMMMLQTAIHTILSKDPNISPSKLLTEINPPLTQNINRFGGAKHVTITVLLMNKSGRITFSGLHEYIMIYRSQSKQVEKIETKGMWIGIDDNIESMLEDEELFLNHGDVLLLYTDGITESWKDGENEDELFGEKRLIDIFCKLGEHTTSEIKDGIFKALEEFKHDDDRTMLILRRIL
ncbi:multi-sensor signal transduction multi-kinase [Candidatus Magnetomorum sp. HK-1]|nr:multi-sensor signal transduction multi-kinase [Candidatus Magnetomorum sp. HK-1]